MKEWENHPHHEGYGHWVGIKKGLCVCVCGKGEVCVRAGGGGGGGIKVRERDREKSLRNAESLGERDRKSYRVNGRQYEKEK